MVEIRGGKELPLASKSCQKRAEMRGKRKG
jgi:hypothetical protein